MAIIFYLLFYLRVILFSSCIRFHLGTCDNDRNQTLPAKHMLALRQRVLVQDDSDDKHYIECVDDYFSPKGYPLLKPWLLGRFLIMPVSRLSDFEQSEQEYVMSILHELVVTNSHIYLKLKALLYYVQHKQADHYHKTFKTIEDIALTAKNRFKSEKEEQFGEVVYQALEAIIKHKGSFERDFYASGCAKFFDAEIKKVPKAEFGEAKKQIEHRKDIWKCDIKVKQAVCRNYKSKLLAITYNQYMHKERLDALHVDGKVYDLYKKHGDTVAAKFYVEAIKILAVTGTEARQKINENFENALQAPQKTAEEVARFIEGVSSSKVRKKTSPNSIKEAQKTTNEQKKTQNLPAKHKNKLNQNKKPSPSTLDQNQEKPNKENICSQSIRKLQNNFRKGGYKLHPRIYRWAGATSNQIKQFDGYVDLTETDIKLQKACHDLKGIALLLFVKDQKDYFFDTPKGKSAFATMTIGDVTYEGILEIGISAENCIYHLYFNYKVKHKPEQLFQMIHPIFEDSWEDSKENDTPSNLWCNKDGYAIEKQDDTYVITMDMPTDLTGTVSEPCRRLCIYPNKLSTKSIKKN